MIALLIATLCLSAFSAVGILALCADMQTLREWMKTLKKEDTR
jgi:hypothetical protein